MKERQIDEWLALLSRPPTEKEILNQFGIDLESVTMAYVLAGIPLPKELQSYCNGLSLLEKLENYSHHPLWFKTFIKQDIETAVQIFKLNRDKDGVAKDIILDWEEDSGFLNLVSQATPFQNNKFELTFKEVVLFNEESKEKNIFEDFNDKIMSGHGMDFDSDYDRSLFYFLELQNHAEISTSDLKELNQLASDFNDFLKVDIKAEGRITDKDVLICLLRDVFNIFQEAVISYDKKEITKQSFDLLKDSLEDLEELGAEELAVLLGGRSLAMGKLIYKIFKYYKKSKDITNNINITFSEEDEQDFFDRFLNQNNTLKIFYINEIKIPLQKIFIKSRMDILMLSDDFFEEEFFKFINSRFYSRIYTLNEVQQKEIKDKKDQDAKDKLIFTYLSRKKIAKIKEDSVANWGSYF